MYKINLVTFKNLFYNLNPLASMPSFLKLMNSLDGRDYHKENGEIYLDDEVEVKLSTCISPIEKICKCYGFDPQITDISLIADDRTITNNEWPHYVGSIYVNTPNANELIEIYKKAVDIPDISKGHEPIVTHSDIFSSKCALVYSLSPFNDLKKDGKRKRSESYYSYRYSLAQLKGVIDVPKRDVEYYVNEFFNNLKFTAEELGKDSMLGSLKNSHFLLLPIVRPKYETPVDWIDDKVKLRGTPGGALFLFFKDTWDDEKDTIEERILNLSQALSWFTAEASMHESYSKFGKQAIEKDTKLLHAKELAAASYSISHPLKHRFGAVSQNIDSLKDFIDDENIFDNQETRELILQKVERLTEAVSVVEEFSELVHLTFRAYTTTNNRSELFFVNGKQSKHSDTQDLNLNKLIDEVTQWKSLGPNHKVRIKPIVNLPKKTRIEPYYSVADQTNKFRLINSFYRIIFYELFDNCAWHGEQNISGEVEINIDFVRNVYGTSDGIVISNVTEMDSRFLTFLENIKYNSNTHNNTWKKWNKSDGKGISFIQDALKNTESGNLHYKLSNINKKSENGIHLYKLEAALTFKGLVISD